MTTVDNSPQARLARLQQNWQDNGAAAKNLQNQISGNTWGNTNTSNTSNTNVNSTTTANTNPQQFTYINNPDWSPVVQNTSAPTNTPAPIQTPVPQVSWAQGVWQMKVNGVWDTSTIDDTANANVKAADANVVATWASEVDSQQALTQDLSQVDKSQMDTKIADAKANQAEAQSIQEQQIALKNQNELEYQKQVQADTDANVAALKVQQDSENNANSAAAAEMKAKNDANEWEMQTQNELQQQQSNIAFAKLGLSFSWAAINTAQNIFMQWTYNLAKLKTGNAKNYADLQVKINKVQFDHTMSVNKLISDAHDKEFSSKERLRDFIGKAQTNILNSKEDSQKAIQSSISTYKTERQTREDKLYSDMNAANARVQTATKDIQAQVQVWETNNKKKIDMLVTNGQWNSLSPQQQVELEKNSWLPPWTTQNTIVAKTTQLLTDGIKTIAWKSVSIPPAILAKMHTEVQRALKLNVPLTTATQIAIQKYSSQIPDIANAKAATKAKAQMDTMKAQADIAVKQSTVQKNMATATKALRVPTWGWTRKSSWWSSTTWIYTKTELVDGKPTTVEYKKGDANYKIVRWQASQVTPQKGVAASAVDTLKAWAAWG